MTQFEIRDQFYLDGQPFKILSGAIQYFRLHPDQWEDTLYNLKALGYNTVETYIPWNLHEPHEGVFEDRGLLDFKAYFDLISRMGLHLIVRPCPYICAEFDFGGLPAWLLNYPGMRYRTYDQAFLAKVAAYYDWLLPQLVPYQFTHGGPILMMQVENEYGSYAEDKDYLRAVAQMMRDRGVDVPLFTSDGTWIEALESGTLIEDDIFVTGNFGSDAPGNTQALQAFFNRHGKQWPLMCTEFWDGWFNRWNEPIVRRDPEDLAHDVKEMMAVGSVNLFLLRGGTNFGFINGCSARKHRDLPQVTSYDFDAPINEWGQPTAKYYAVQRVTHELFPDLPQFEPRSRQARAYGTYPVLGWADLLEVADQLGTGQEVDYPLAMEALGQHYGYTLYRTRVAHHGHPERLKIINAHDRVQVFIQGKHLVTQYREDIGDEVLFDTDQATAQVDVLVENMGRVNYGFKLNSPTQSKGIKGGVMINHQFRKGFRQYALEFKPDMLAAVSYHEGPRPTQAESPHFYRFEVELDQIQDTFIDCSAYGKGCVCVNGFNLGRYWSQGPIQYLYVPSGFLKAHNEFVVFETESVPVESLNLVDQPVYRSEEEEAEV